MKKVIIALFFGLVLGPLLANGQAYAQSPAATNDQEQTILGNDISYPQCGKTLPEGQAFGIVGVNDGTANTTNRCLTKELAWATRSTGITSQPKVQLYVNTANPGGLGTDSWPRSNIDPSGNLTLNTYGTCSGDNTLSCAWQYGWNRALEDAQHRFPLAAQYVGISANPSDYRWWLDVETINTWQSGSDFALASNTADLEGMVAYFKSINAYVGLYSTTYQWGKIVGSVPESSNLNGLDNWRPGARNLKGAKQNCSLPLLTRGGQVTMTQFVFKNLDYNYSCIG